MNTTIEATYYKQTETMESITIDVMVENDQLFVQLQIKNLYRRIPEAIFLKANEFITLFEKARFIYNKKRKDIDIITVNDDFAIRICDEGFYIDLHIDAHVYDEISSSIGILKTIFQMIEVDNIFDKIKTHPKYIATQQ